MDIVNSSFFSKNIKTSEKNSHEQNCTSKRVEASDDSNPKDVPFKFFSSEKECVKQMKNPVRNDEVGLKTKDFTENSPQSNRKGWFLQGDELPPGKTDLDDSIAVQRTAAASQMVNARQQRENNRTVVRFKEQLKEYHSEMIRSIITSNEGKRKQVGEDEIAKKKDMSSKSGVTEGRFCHTLSKMVNDSNCGNHCVDTSTTVSTGKCNLNKNNASYTIESISSSLRTQIKDSARYFCSLTATLNGRSSPIGNFNSKVKSDCNMAGNKARIKPDRKAFHSVDMPLNLATKNSCVSTSYAESSCSFPSLPSFDKLQFPKSAHELPFPEGSRSILRNTNSNGGASPLLDDINHSKKDVVCLLNFFKLGKLF